MEIKSLGYIGFGAKDPQEWLKFGTEIKLTLLKDYKKIINHVLKAKLPSDIKNYFSYKGLNKILNFMSKDKKNISKNLNLILLKEIGSAVIHNEYQILKVRNFLKKELTNQNL